MYEAYELVLACDNSRQHKAHERGANSRRSPCDGACPSRRPSWGLSCEPCAAPCLQPLPSPFFELQLGVRKRRANKSSTITSMQHSQNARQRAQHGSHRGCHGQGGRAKASKTKKRRARQGSCRPRGDNGKRRSSTEQSAAHEAAENRRARARANDARSRPLLSSTRRHDTSARTLAGVAPKRRPTLLNSW